MRNRKNISSGMMMLVAVGLVVGFFASIALVQGSIVQGMIVYNAELSKPMDGMELAVSEAITDTNMISDIESKAAGLKIKLEAGREKAMQISYHEYAQISLLAYDEYEMYVLNIEDAAVELGRASEANIIYSEIMELMDSFSGKSETFFSYLESGDTGEAGKVLDMMDSDLEDIEEKIDSASAITDMPMNQRLSDTVEKEKEVVGTLRTLLKSIEQDDQKSSIIYEKLIIQMIDAYELMPKESEMFMEMSRWHGENIYSKLIIAEDHRQAGDIMLDIISEPGAEPA